MRKITILFLSLLSGVAFAQPASFDFPAGCNTPSPFNNTGVEFVLEAQLDGLAPEIGQDWAAVFNADGDVVGRAVISLITNSAGVDVPGAFIIIRESNTSGSTGCPTRVTTSGSTTLTVRLSDNSNGDAILTASNSTFNSSVTAGLVNGPDNDPSTIDLLNFLSSSLPVTLTDFTATPGQAEVSLSWATSEELNNDYFDVQRSTNPETGFVSIGKVRGNETTTELSTYAFADLNPAAGVNYYRLEQFDFDGTATFSPVVIAEVATAPELGLRAFPNPALANGRLSIQLRGDWQAGTTVRMTDATGRVVKTWDELTTGSLNTQVPALRAGVYQLVATNGRNTRTARVVVR